MTALVVTKHVFVGDYRSRSIVPRILILIRAEGKFVFVLTDITIGHVWQLVYRKYNAYFRTLLHCFDGLRVRTLKFMQDTICNNILNLS